MFFGRTAEKDTLGASPATGEWRPSASSVIVSPKAAAAKTSPPSPPPPLSPLIVPEHTTPVWYLNMNGALSTARDFTLGASDAFRKAAAEAKKDFYSHAKVLELAKTTASDVNELQKKLDTEHEQLASAVDSNKKHYDEAISHHKSSLENFHRRKNEVIVKLQKRHTELKQNRDVLITELTKKRDELRIVKRRVIDAFIKAAHDEFKSVKASNTQSYTSWFFSATRLASQPDAKEIEKKMWEGYADFRRRFESVGTLVMPQPSPTANATRADVKTIIFEPEAPDTLMKKSLTKMAQDIEKSTVSALAKQMKELEGCSDEFLNCNNFADKSFQDLQQFAEKSKSEKAKEMVRKIEGQKKDNASPKNTATPKSLTTQYTFLIAGAASQQAMAKSQYADLSDVIDKSQDEELKKEIAILRTEAEAHEKEFERLAITDPVVETLPSCNISSSVSHPTPYQYYDNEMNEELRQQANDLKNNLDQAAADLAERSDAFFKRLEAKKKAVLDGAKSQNFFIRVKIQEYDFIKIAEKKNEEATPSDEPQEDNFARLTRAMRRLDYKSELEREKGYAELKTAAFEALKEARAQVEKVRQELESNAKQILDDYNSIYVQFGVERVAEQKEFEEEKQTQLLRLRESLSFALRPIVQHYADRLANALKQHQELKADERTRDVDYCRKHVAVFRELILASSDYDSVCEEYKEEIKAIHNVDRSLGNSVEQFYKERLVDEEVLQADRGAKGGLKKELDRFAVIREEAEEVTGSFAEQVKYKHSDRMIAQIELFKTFSLAVSDPVNIAHWSFQGDEKNGLSPRLSRLGSCSSIDGKPVPKGVAQQYDLVQKRAFGSYETMNAALIQVAFDREKTWSSFFGMRDEKVTGKYYALIRELKTFLTDANGEYDIRNLTLTMVETFRRKLQRPSDGTRSAGCGLKNLDETVKGDASPVRGLYASRR
jgi:hypothetical protein